MSGYKLFSLCSVTKKEGWMGLNNNVLRNSHKRFMPAKIIFLIIKLLLNLNVDYNFDGTICILDARKRCACDLKMAFDTTHLHLHSIHTCHHTVKTRQSIQWTSEYENTNSSLNSDHENSRKLLQNSLMLHYHNVLQNDTFLWH